MSKPTIAGYRLLETIGQGASGVVYRAVQLSLDREVAVKVLADDSHGEAVKRFKRESRLSLQLAHPNVVTVYDAGVSDGRSYLAMELVDGGTLALRIAREGPADASTVTTTTLALLEGLGYLHAKGILHRDVKPANILVGRQGELKLVDFGLARQEASTLLTADQGLVGTLSYIAPELFGGEAPSQATDVYALGLVVMELILGRPVFPHGEIKDMIRRVMTERVPTPREAGLHDLDPRFEELVTRMVSRDPASRPRTAGALETIRKVAFQRGLSRSLGPLDRPTAPRVREITASGRGLPGWSATLSRVREGLLPQASFALLIGGIALGLLLDSRLPSRSGPSAPAPSALAPSPGGPSAETLAWMRAGCAEGWKLLNRYDATCMPLETGAEAIRLRAMMLGDTFFRSRAGEQSLLFSALVKMAAVIERGDQERVQHPVWFEVHHMVYALVEEVARSNGFDKGSSLRRPLEAVESSLRGSWTGERHAIARSAETGFSYFRTLSSKVLAEHLEVYDQLWALVQREPGSWKRSPAGCAVRLEILRRELLQGQEVIRLMDEGDGGARMEALRADSARALSAVGAEPELATTMQGSDEPMAVLALLEIATCGLRFHGEDRARREEAAALFNRVAPRLVLRDLPSRWHGDLRRMLLPLARLRERHPELELAAVPGITATEETTPLSSPMTRSGPDARE